MATRILLTGAADRIGQAFLEYTGDRYKLRLGVHHRSKLEDPGKHEVVEFDIADLAACQQACQDSDTDQ
jgi:nucleoside-diphosphate-sugar epimerase